MPNEDDRKRKYFALMERYNQLGLLLPAPDAFDPTDAAALVEARMVIAEMNKVRAEMEALG